MPRPQTTAHTLCEPAQSKKHVKDSQEPLYTEIYRKNAAAQNHGPHFVWACAVEKHVKNSQEPLYTEIYRKNAAAQNHGPHFVRACAVYTEIYKKNAAAQSEDPDQAPALHLP